MTAIIESSRVRNESDAAILRARGYDVDSKHIAPLFAMGQACVEGTDKRITALYNEWAAQPLAEDLLRGLRDRTLAEKRELITDAPLSSFTVGPLSGDWQVPGIGGGRISPTPTAVSHLASYLTGDKHAGAYLGLVSDKQIQAFALNRYLDTFKRGEADRAETARGAGEKFSPRKLNVAVKRGLGGPFPVAYRVATGRYQHAVEIPQAISALLETDVIPSTMRGSLLYDGETARIRLTDHASQVIDPSCGDFFQAGLDLLFDDAKNSSILVQGVAFRNQCLNYYYIGETKRIEARARHMGSAEGIVKTVLDGVRAVAADFESFRTRWTDARRDQLISELTEQGAQATFQALVAGGLVTKIPGSADEKVTRLMNAWNAEPGYTRADVVNAVTRAAHEGSWSSPWASAEVEAEGSALLYVRALNTRVEAGKAAWSQKYAN